MKHNVSLVIPTWNGGALLEDVLASVRRQTQVPEACFLVDSSSTVSPEPLARKYGFQVHTLPQAQFNHGGTRRWAVERLCRSSDYVIMMTQDAVLADEKALEHLLGCLQQPQVALAYGRQLPRPQAGPCEAHARLFNYPAQSRLQRREDLPLLGLKAAFASDSFAAYRRDVLLSIGNFPERVILGEDMHVAARLLLAGWHVAYCAEAQAYHSHNYSWSQECCRAFDTGVFHAQESWLLHSLGRAEGEGLRFVQSQWSYLRRQGLVGLALQSLAKNVAKYLAYQLGRRQQRWPRSICARLSASSGYWREETPRG